MNCKIVYSQLPGFQFFISVVLLWAYRTQGSGIAQTTGWLETCCHVVMMSQILWESFTTLQSSWLTLLIYFCYPKPECYTAWMQVSGIKCANPLPGSNPQWMKIFLLLLTFVTLLTMTLFNSSKSLFGTEFMVSLLQYPALKITVLEQTYLHTSNLIW